MTAGPSELAIVNGPLRATVRPEAGGALTGLWYLPKGRHREPVPVLRPAPPGARSPLEMASFPLVPFCNRIAGGTFRWEGETYHLPPNHAGDAFPLHGYGWYGRWRTVAVDDAALDLAWDDPGTPWPWACAARQRYGLTPDALVVTLSLENRSSTPMPAGLGHHPYFPRRASTRLTARLPTLWAPDAHLIPTGPVPNPRADAFARGLAVESLRVDEGYTGWDGRAVIEQPDDGLRIELLGAPDEAFHLYVPDAPYFCAEAVTNQPNAINDPRAVAPMVALAPGATLHYTLRLRVAPAAQTSATPS
jgi:aldose 1-epimerase